MKEMHTRIDKHGRVLIPSHFRNLLNYKPGDTFVIRASNDELHITSLAKTIKDAQNLFKQHNHSSTSVVEEFLKLKYLEANKENINS